VSIRGRRSGEQRRTYTLELLDQLGRADRLPELPHYPARHFRLHTPTATITTADYGKLRGRFDYVALMPQARFLDFLAEQAARLPAFTLRLGAKVTRLVDDDGVVTGVRYHDRNGTQTLPARLVVGAAARWRRRDSCAGSPPCAVSGRVRRRPTPTDPARPA
jgi:2-polyprenyl-6-methoxyphenol hydroxylase-like FAD-dependent oxidoreductase